MIEKPDKPPSDIETIDPVDVDPSRKQVIKPCLTILYHPDLDRVGDRLVLFENTSKEPNAISRLEPAFSRPDGTSARALDTPFVSRKPTWLAPAAAGGVRLSPEEGGTEVAADGEPVYTSRKFTASEIERGVVLEFGKRVVLLLHAAGSTRRCDRRLGFVGESEPMERLRETLLKVALQAAPVLLKGESGVGKELAAMAIHGASARAQGPFIPVNLAAVPTSTAASELFGHTAGAFTGATGEHLGYFRQAHGGSLFLDEIGTTSMELQAMLLRVLETGETQPVGAGTTSRVDVRVLVATDEDLNKAIDDGRFRAPLFYRLSASQVEVPPLRERRDDIGRLLIHFLRHELTAADLAEKLAPAGGNMTPWLPARLVARLAGYTWPGNVRQLHNTVRQMVIAYGDSDSVDTGELVSKLDVSNGKSESARESDQPARRESSPRPAEIGEEDLVAAMHANRFSIKSTAEALGISRSSLYALIERSQRLRKARDIDRQEMQTCQRECGGDLDAMADRLEVSKKALKLRLKELGLD